jgi:single-strand DNA-binding protein
MRNINKVILVGNVCRDPQMKEVGEGQPVTTFGIATSRVFTTKAGEKKAITEFHSIVTWGPLAQRCVETLKKGKLVYIEGYLKTHAFETPDGKKNFRTEVVGYNMIILSKKANILEPEMKGEENTGNVEESMETGMEDDNTF